MEPDFDSVWSRVTGGGSLETTETQLRRFLLAEAEDVCALQTLLRQVCDACVRKRLIAVQNEKLRHMKRLRAALYLLTGECVCPAIKQASSCPEPLAALKSLYERAGHSAAAYRKAAADTDRSALKTIYSSLAEAEECHSQVLLECTEQLLSFTCRTAQS